VPSSPDEKPASPIETSLPARPRRGAKATASTAPPPPSPNKRPVRAARRSAPQSLKEEEDSDQLLEVEADAVVVKKEHIHARNKTNGVEVDVKTETVIKEEAVVQISASSPRKIKTKAQIKKIKDEEAEAEEAIASPSRKKASKKRKLKGEDLNGQADDGAEVEGEVKPKRKRKTAEEKAAEAMPLAARTLGGKLFIGAHVSSAKGWWASVQSLIVRPGFASRLLGSLLVVNYVGISIHLLNLLLFLVGVHNAITNAVHIG
jgi:hypothetical protein